MLRLRWLSEKYGRLSILNIDKAGLDCETLHNMTQLSNNVITTEIEKIFESSCYDN